MEEKIFTVQALITSHKVSGKTRPQIQTLFSNTFCNIAKQNWQTRSHFFSLRLSKKGRGSHCHSPKCTKAACIATLLKNSLVETSLGSTTSSARQCQILPMLSNEHFHCCYTIYWIWCHFLHCLQMRSGLVSGCSSSCLWLDLGSSWSLTTVVAACGQGFAGTAMGKSHPPLPRVSPSLLKRWLRLDCLCPPKASHLSVNVVKGGWIITQLPQLPSLMVIA